MGTEIFKVDANIQEKLQEKWADFNIKAFDLNFGPNKLFIESCIGNEYLRKNEEATKDIFKALCLAFTKVCYENKIPCNPLDIFIVVENEIDRALSTLFLDENDNENCFILLPPIYLKSDVWMYFFLHELSHSWVAKKPGWKPSNKQELIDMELLIDLIAICSLKQLIPSHKRFYRDVIKNMSYFGTQESKEYLGAQLHKRAIDNPDEFFKNIRKAYKK